MGQVLWEPTKAQRDATLLADFADKLGDATGKDLTDYDVLWAWSVENIGPFWDFLWDYSGVIGDKSGPALINEERLTEAKFFPEAKINFAENMLQTSGTETALVGVTENGSRTEWSWDDLRAMVSRLQQALSARGLQAGDRVAGIVPNSPYTIALCLAVTSLGGIWSSCSPDFGFKGAMDRFDQVAPRFLVCGDGYTYNGKQISSVIVAGQLAAAIDSVESFIVFPFLPTDADPVELPELGQTLAEFIADFSAKPLQFTRMPFNDPLFIMFSSGTTGLPKSITHSIGGVTLQHIKEHQLHCDLHPCDTLFFYSTCGWMMWNWLVSGLGSGATLVLYDGSPFYPDGNRMAEILQAEGVTHFGTSAKYLDFCSKSGIAPVEHHDLNALRCILSTGSPLSDQSFDYVYDKWKSDLCLSSISGGTDILGCFVGGSPISPVIRGECQKRLLGMNVHVYDDDGNAIQGAQGELVCISPHPTQPVGFWNDTNNAKYHAAYFDRFENTWHQGDYVELTENGGMRFYGRSDAVLNPGGVRIGTAEIYRQIDQIDDILEGIIVGQNWDNDQRLVLFVRLQPGVEFSDDLVKRIRADIRKNATPRHVPAIILPIADIPRTKSGKIAEIAVRDVLHGKEVKNTSSLANPEALELYKGLPELS